MTERTLAPPAGWHAAREHPLADRLARRLVFRALRGLREGRLTLIERDSSRRFGPAGPVDLEARVFVRHPSLYRAVALRGSVGAGEAYARRAWDANDPAAPVRLLARNAPVLDELESSLAWLSRPGLRLVHALRPNTPHGSRRNVAAHYDLGNDFFASFLDPTMTYSCGVFAHPGATMAEASLAKYDRVIDKLSLAPGARVLEIGSGWGGFALRAAARSDARVTTTTVSRSQYELAARRIGEAGLRDRIELHLDDYRELGGRYDRVVSIEMIEAIGGDHFADYFRVLSERLVDDGRAVLQVITIPDQRFAQAARSVDFIKRHIFPGGCLPSVQALLEAARDASDLRLVHLEDLTPHYAETLRRWRRALRARWQELRGRGYGEELLRTFEFYFAYCEGGFEERSIGLAQLVFDKPRARHAVLARPQLPSAPTGPRPVAEPRPGDRVPHEPGSGRHGP